MEIKQLVMNTRGERVRNKALERKPAKEMVKESASWLQKSISKRNGGQDQEVSQIRPLRME